MTDLLSEETKNFLRLALDSHTECRHEDPRLCYTLTLLEVEIRRDDPLSDDEVEASRTFIADYILEGLILKGYVEPVGFDSETGEFYLGLTEDGKEAADDFYVAYKDQDWYPKQEEDEEK